jgi:hypothetical protein
MIYEKVICTVAFKLWRALCVISDGVRPKYAAIVMNILVLDGNIIIVVILTLNCKWMDCTKPTLKGSAMVY